MAKTKTDSQTIDQLRARYEDLNSQRIVFQTKRDSALEQLDELKATALKQYGTDDIDQLQKKLEELKKENEEKRKAYQKSLDEIESKLDSIQGEFEEDVEE
jgi:chromosome segregation ATPase